MFDRKKSMARKAAGPEGEGEHFAAQHVPFVSFAHDQEDVIVLKDGSVMASLLVDGIPASTGEIEDTMQVSRGVATLINRLPPTTCVYVHKLIGPSRPQISKPSGAGSFVEEACSRWNEHLANADLRTSRLILTIVVKPKSVKAKRFQKKDDSLAKQRVQLQKAIVSLNESIGQFKELLGAVGVARLRKSSSWLSYLKAMIYGDLRTVSQPANSFVPIADIITTRTIEFSHDRFVTTAQSDNSARVGVVLGLKEAPEYSYAGMFDHIDANCSVVVCHSFTPVDRVKAESDMRRKVGQMKAADDAAVSLREQLNDCTDDVASGRSGIGNHQTTFTLFADTEEQLEASVAEVRGDAEKIGASLVREDLALRPAFFSVIPGNVTYRARKALLTNDNFAHMAALHCDAKGSGGHMVPWGQPLAILPTATNQAYRFNLHLPGRKGQLTVGHTLVLGRTGDGKTVGAAAIMAFARRLGTRCIVFDKDFGFKTAIHAMGGAYSSVRMGEPSGCNPFATECDQRGSSWLTGFLLSILFRDDKPTPTQKDALQKAVAANMETSEHSLRSLSDFRSLLRATDDQGDLFTRFSEWDKEGQFGWLFAKGGKDAMKFDNPITGFDLSEIFDNDEIRTAWLGYCFQRLERLVEDQKPTLIIMDEAWKLLDDEYFAKKIKDWMLTMRKKNVAVMMLTQTASHITECAAGSSIIESVATFLIYPNGRNSIKEFEPFKLTDGEEQIVTTDMLGLRGALIKNGNQSALVNMDLSALGGLVGILGAGPGTSLNISSFETLKEDWKNYV